MRPRFVEQIIGPDAAAHDPLIPRSLNPLLTNSRSYEAVRFSTLPPQKNIRLRKSGGVEEAVPAQACEFIEYRLSESLRRIPSLRSRCPIDESKWSGA